VAIIQRKSIPSQPYKKKKLEIFPNKQWKRIKKKLINNVKLYLSERLKYIHSSDYSVFIAVKNGLIDSKNVQLIFNPKKSSLIFISNGKIYSFTNKVYNRIDEKLTQLMDI